MRFKLEDMIETIMSNEVKRQGKGGVSLVQMYEKDPKTWFEAYWL